LIRSDTEKIFTGDFEHGYAGVLYGAGYGGGDGDEGGGCGGMLGELEKAGDVTDVNFKEDKFKKYTKAKVEG